MPMGRALGGAVVAAGLIAGLCACGGADADTTTRSIDSPLPTSSTPSTATPTPVDPTVAAKAKVMADYQYYIATRSRGIVSNSPTFPFEKVMTGNALSAIKSAMGGTWTAGAKYSGSVRFVKGEVAVLNLKSKPATAIVQACVYDGLKLTSKSGKVTSSAVEVSRRDQLVLIGGRWKATETKGLNRSEPGCA